MRRGMSESQAARRLGGVIGHRRAPCRASPARQSNWRSRRSGSSRPVTPGSRTPHRAWCGSSALIGDDQGGTPSRQSSRQVSAAAPQAATAAGRSRCRPGSPLTLLDFVPLAGLVHGALPGTGDTVVFSGELRSQSTAVPACLAQCLQCDCYGLLALLPARTAPVRSPPVTRPASRGAQPAGADVFLPGRPERFDGLLVVRSHW